MTMQRLQQIWGAVRHVGSTSGGLLIAFGVMTQSQYAAITGGIMALGAVISSWKSKQKPNQKPNG